MKLTRISLDDWEGFYNEEGKLLCEGHSIRASDLANSLNYEVEYHYIANDDLDEFGNCLPKNLEAILNYIKNK